jgi:hypothetical protein
VSSGQRGTHIRFALRRPGSLRVNIYNLLGQHVFTLFEGFGASGAQSLVWDGRTATGAVAAPGLYIVSLENEGYPLARKILLLY